MAVEQAQVLLKYQIRVLLEPQRHPQIEVASEVGDRPGLAQVVVKAPLVPQTKAQVAVIQVRVRVPDQVQVAVVKWKQVAILVVPEPVLVSARSAAREICPAPS